MGRWPPGQLQLGVCARYGQRKLWLCAQRLLEFTDADGKPDTDNTKTPDTTVTTNYGLVTTAGASLRQTPGGVRDGFPRSMKLLRAGRPRSAGRVSSIR